MTVEHHYSFARIVFMWGILVYGNLFNYFHALTTAVLQPHLMAEFNIDAATVTYIGSMCFYGYLIMQIPTGFLSDTLGIKITAIIGTTLSSVGTLCFALAVNPLMLYIGRSFMGFGIATVFVCILKFQLAWMPSRIIGTMTGLSCFLGMLGGVAAQSPLAWLIQSIGWRESMFSVGCASFINLLLIILFVKDSPHGRSKSISNQEQKSTDIVLSKALKSILYNPATWPPIILYSTFYGAYVVMVGYSGTSWLTNVYNLSVLEASFYLTLCVFGSAIGYVVIGYFADKLQNRKKPMLISGFIYILCWGTLSFFSSSLPLWFIAMLLFAMGFFSCAVVVCWSCVQAVNAPQYSGIAASVVNMFGFVAPIGLPYIFIFTQNIYEAPLSAEAFQMAFIMMFAAVLLGYLCSFLTKDVKNSSK